MNYLTEPRGVAVPFGMYQDLGEVTAKQTKAAAKVWNLYQKRQFDGAVRLTASYKKATRIVVYKTLEKKGVSKKDMAAFRAAVMQPKKAGAATEAEGPNYLLWGGIALAAAGGAYFLFFRKKKGKKQ